MSSSPSKLPTQQGLPPADNSDLHLDLLAWFEKNRNLVSGLLFAIVALVVGKMVFSHLSRSKEASASHKLLNAFPLSTPGETATPSVSSDTLLKLVSELQGTRAAERATLMAAGQLFAEGKFDEARKNFDSFVQNFPENPFAQTAKFGSAASLDALNKLPEAIQAYQDIATRLAGQPLANQAKIAIARINESKGDFEKAFATYDELVKAGMFTPIGQQASIRREALMLAHPELNKPASMTNDVRVVSPTPLPSVTIPAAASPK